MPSVAMPLCEDIDHDGDEVPEAVAIAPLYSNPTMAPYAHAAFCRPCMRDWRAGMIKRGLSSTALLLVASDDY